jgi:hypothetical protein
MELSLKNKVIIVICYTAACVAIGRYATPTKVKVETKTITVEKKSDDKNTETKKQNHKKTVTHTTIEPNGKKDIVSVTTDDNDAYNTVDEKKDNSDNTTQNTASETTGPVDKVTISGLVGIDFKTGQPIYGGSVSRPILGPITLGLFGLSNLSCGMSIGLQF